MNVFLSYNSLDRPAALRVADALAKRGIETFLDVRSLIPGQRWQGKLAEALSDYDAAARYSCRLHARANRDDLCCHQPVSPKSGGG